LAKCLRNHNLLLCRRGGQREGEARKNQKKPENKREKEGKKPVRKEEGLDLYLRKEKRENICLQGKRAPIADPKGKTGGLKGGGKNSTGRH